MIVNNRFKTYFIFSFLFLNSINIFSQDIEFKKANFKRDKDGLKLAKENISIGDDIRNNAIKEMLAMQDADVLFRQALFYYDKAQTFNPNNAELNYKIGSSWLFTNDKSKAYAYLMKAKEFNVDLPVEFLFYFGMVLQLQGEYTNAIEYFNKFSKTAKKKVFSPYEVFVRKYIKE